MTLKELYTTFGGDYDETLRRLLSEAFVKKYVLKFPSDQTYADLLRARKAKDINAAFTAAHTLKGITSTLGFKDLARVASELTEELRPRTHFPEDKFFDAVDDAYAVVFDNIAQYVSEHQN